MNLLRYSEQFDNAAWSKSAVTITANDITSPDGYTNADKMVESATTSGHYILQSPTLTAAAYTFTIFAKAGERNWFLFRQHTLGLNASFNLATGTLGTIAAGLTATIEDYGNDWYRCSVTFTGTAAAHNFRLYVTTADNSTSSYLGDGTSGLYLYGAGCELGSYATSYIPTFATAQTSPVLLPQGLTANKDITGVNAFESARNPYALNLDGASWAEVHDNASLDITSAITLEGWVYVDVSKDIRGALVAKYKFSQNARAYSLELDDLTLKCILSNNGTSTTSVAGSTTISTTGWYHFVGTYDGANVKVYLNGSEDNTTAYSSGVYAQDYPVTIGVLDTASKATSIMEDQIALPRIYNRALTATEVLRNYNADKSKFGL